MNFSVSLKHSYLILSVAILGINTEGIVSLFLFVLFTPPFDSIDTYKYTPTHLHTHLHAHTHTHTHTHTHILIYLCVRLWGYFLSTNIVHGKKR